MYIQSVWGFAVHSISQHSATWWSDGHFTRQEAGFRVQCGTLYSIRRHSATWWSDGHFTRQEAGLELSVEPSIWSVDTAPPGGQTDILRGKRWGLELSVEHSIPAVSTAPPGGQTDILRGKRQGYGTLCCLPARSQEQGRSEAACVQYGVISLLDCCVFCVQGSKTQRQNQQSLYGSNHCVLQSK